MRRAVKSMLVLGVGIAGLSGYGYYRFAVSRLAAPAGAVVTVGVSAPTASLTGGTLPVTFEAYVKDAGAHNFLSTSRSIGLVRARYEWSHAELRWVEDTGFAERQDDAVRARRSLASREVGALLADLRSDDPVRREIAGRELFLRTGQTLGYAYDASKADRDAAVSAWTAFLSKEENRALAGRREAGGALDTLKRALGDRVGAGR